MIIRLIPEKIIECIPSDEELSDQSIMESIYVIRKLKALAESQEIGFIEVDPTKESDGQRYSDKFEIWFRVGTFIII